MDKKTYDAGLAVRRAVLGAEYVDETSQKRNPVMLHRAIVGSIVDKVK